MLWDIPIVTCSVPFFWLNAERFNMSNFKGFHVGLHSGWSPRSQVCFFGLFDVLVAASWLLIESCSYCLLTAMHGGQMEAFGRRAGEGQNADSWPWCTQSDRNLLWARKPKELDTQENFRANSANESYRLLFLQNKNEYTLRVHQKTKKESFETTHSTLKGQRWVD